MGGRNRSQSVYLTVQSRRIAFLPPGTYSIHINDTRIVDGSVRVNARIVKSISLVTADELKRIQGLTEEGEKNGD